MATLPASQPVKSPSRSCRFRTKERAISSHLHSTRLGCEAISKSSGIGSDRGAPQKFLGRDLPDLPSSCLVLPEYPMVSRKAYSRSTGQQIPESGKLLGRIS